ncbi:unnamed protein product [Lymnaea stagnalis]|uniref:Uncharacterized protein n=1 Tax=Lymnaea stagnalis TaxID=6523 RepID=A0AAV2IDB2_LYMST
MPGCTDGILKMRLFVTIVTLVFCCMDVGFGESEITESVCRINCDIYALGASIGKVLDGCNNCWCGNSGFGCTRMACPWYQPLECEIQGNHYNHNDIVPSDDCQECRCMNGNLACTGCPA